MYSEENGHSHPPLRFPIFRVVTKKLSGTFVMYNLIENNFGSKDFFLKSVDGFRCFLQKIYFVLLEPNTKKLAIRQDARVCAVIKTASMNYIPRNND